MINAAREQERALALAAAAAGPTTPAKGAQ
jgi:hypothetical protein